MHFYNAIDFGLTWLEGAQHMFTILISVLFAHGWDEYGDGDVFVNDIKCFSLSLLSS